MLHLLLALPLGALIGFSLGALGAGGSILTVPALVLVIGQTPHEAAATSLVIVGSTAAIAAISHYRRGAVRLRAALVFAAAGIVGSLAGTYASSRTDADALTLAFAAIMVVAAAFMWRSARGTHRARDHHGPGPSGGVRALRTVAAGTIVGALTGYFGIGGGFLAVPALTYALDLEIATAVGTSLVVIALNAATALAPRLADNLIDAKLTAAFVLGGIVGAVLGTTIAHHARPATLKRSFAGVVVVTAMALATTTITG